MDRNRSAGYAKISLGANALLNAVMIAYMILCIFPVLLVIIVSFSNNDDIIRYGYSFIPQRLSLLAYQYLIEMGSVIWHSYGVSIFVTLVGTLASLVIVSLYAYPIARRDFKHRNLASFVVFFTMIFNGGLVPWYMVYLHLIPIKDTIWILIVPYLMNAWYVLIMRTFYRTTVPDELLEAAKLDGASEFRTFFSIVLPISKAGLATIALFSMLQYWNDWYLPLVFVTQTKMYNIQYVLYQILSTIQWLAQNSSNVTGVVQQPPGETARMAIAVLSVGPIIFAYPFFQRYFIQGLTIGALKG